MKKQAVIPILDNCLTINIIICHHPYDSLCRFDFVTLFDAERWTGHRTSITILFHYWAAGLTVVDLLIEPSIDRSIIDCRTAGVGWIVGRSEIGDNIIGNNIRKCIYYCDREPPISISDPNICGDTWRRHEVEQWTRLIKLLTLLK